MIGIRAGVACGLRCGIAAGISADPIGGGSNPMAGVSQDASSLRYVPASGSEWTTTMTAAALASGNPSGLWLCQEASGNLADSIGANPLVVAGSPTYANSNTGWTRKSVNITATTVQAFTLGTGPFDASATSVAWLWYGCITATGGGRSVLAPSGNATQLSILHLASDKLQIKCGANSATSVQSYTTSTIFPMLLVYDRTHSTCTLFTDKEALSCTFAAVVDGSKGLGAAGTLTGDSAARTTYLAAFSGAAAELTTNNARSLLTTLNWSPLF